MSDTKKKGGLYHVEVRFPNCSAKTTGSKHSNSTAINSAQQELSIAGLKSYFGVAPTSATQWAGTVSEGLPETIKIIHFGVSQAEISGLPGGFGGHLAPFLQFHGTFYQLGHRS